MLNRRDFLRLSAAASASAATLGAIVPTHAHAAVSELKSGGIGYARLSGTQLESKPTACAMCPAHCSAIAYYENNHVVKLEGQPESLRTQGRICAKGQASLNQLYDPDRIVMPLRRTGKRGEGQWKQVSWDEAIGEIADRLKKLRDAGTPEKFMFHHGWISQGAYHLIRELFLPAYGTATVADNSCFGQSGRRTAHELTWGAAQDSWDIDNARFVLNFGSNVLEAHTNHVALARRLSIALAERQLKMVTFDVRLSNTAARSQRWYQIKPGTDAAVILAMCHQVVKSKAYVGAGEQFLEYCQVSANPAASVAEKIAELEMHLAPFTPEWAEGVSGVPAADIVAITDELTRNNPACIISSRGASAQYNGVETERAILLLSALTGNLDSIGSRRQAVIPSWQPPQLAERPAPRKLDILEGLDETIPFPLFGLGHLVLNTIKDGRNGRPDVYMWYSYNPVFSNGDTSANDAVLRSEELLPFTVAVTPFYDESAALADLILPDAVFLETWDFESDPSPNQIPEYTIRQPIMEPLGEARDFKEVVCQLAQAIGLQLPVTSAEDLVSQTCENTKVISDGAGGFQGMQEKGLWFDKSLQVTDRPYLDAVPEAELAADGTILDEATGVYWNWRLAGVADEASAKSQGYRNTPGAAAGYVAQRFSSGVHRGFRPGRLNKSGYFEIYSSLLADKGMSALPIYREIPEHQNLDQTKLILTTYKENVHTSFRTQNSAWLNEISHDNPGWINPESATALGLQNGDRVTLSTDLAAITVSIRVTEAVVPGVVALSSHHGHWQSGRYASGAPAPYGIEEVLPSEQNKWWPSDGQQPNAIIANRSEPISGQQRWMDSVVSVRKADASAA